MIGVRGSRVSKRIFPEAVVALVSGGGAALGFQPLGWWPVTLIAMALLFQLVRQAQHTGRAALLGWIFGVGLFSVGNNWIATAFTYQAAMPAWLGWVAVVLLALYLAIYPALATGAAVLILSRRHGAGLTLVPALAGTWIVTEWLRGWVFTGFAWNPVGAVALGGFARPGLASALPWLGTYGLSGLVVALSGVLWWAMVRGRSRQWWQTACLALLPFLLFVAPWPLQSSSDADSRTGGLHVTLVQPNVRQELLNDPAHFGQQFEKSAALTTPNRQPEARRIVLWPESGVPDHLRAGYPQRYYGTTFAGDPALARARLARTIGPHSLLLTGTVDLVIDEAGQAVAARNVVTVIDDQGEIAAGYAKAHLVPYGEYLPMRSLLEPIGLSRLVEGSLDFEDGPGPRTLDLGEWGKAAIQICYEIIFPGNVVDDADRPDYIVNPSNDGWFGAWGPPQHLAQARMRAIEEGLPVLRPTTTGISAIVDAAGVVRAHIGRGTAARIDTLVPPAFQPTLFARLGNYLSLFWALVLLVIAAVATRRARG
ncbi:apolipoprotein N-acyltransferase [Croceicoccus sp. F390]|uniref:Apolipoprotein N-acyltransferase n=1 Tax=Croceicoccus esteveae TaxID=3075597 RepID=A0ABU2ZDZ3_9SPHN|nr:apolipoprotein N-acyltransferase [Croceicoccus sp. F390]MDT0574590.1 apolipoprotein N-acyltransferase [Croceicoccus sp. F390]